MTEGPVELIASQPATRDSIDRALDGNYTAERVGASETDEVLRDTSLDRLHIRTESYRILDDLQKTVARMDVLVPELITGRGPATPLSARLRVAEVRGYGDERDEVIEALRPVLGLTPTDRTLPDEAVLAGGGRPDGFSTKVEVALDPEEPSAPAVARVLRALLEVIEANEPGTLADSDPEFLHDYRVSIRRTRAVQRQFKHVFPPGRLAHSRQKFKWLQRSTGDARDLDVYVLGFDSLRDLVPAETGRELEPLLTVLRRRRTVAHGSMGRALRSQRAREAFAEWKQLLDVLDHGPDADRAAGKRAIGETASRRIRKVYRRMVKMGDAIGPGSPPDEFHELRKKGKELRYLLELFGQPLHDPAVVKPMIKTLKGLQDVLGHHQDREVQMVMLRSLADEVAVLPGGPRALMAMGVLTSRLEEDAARARREFAEVFAKFAGKHQRKLVKDTFA